MLNTLAISTRSGIHDPVSIYGTIRLEAAQVSATAVMRHFRLDQLGQAVTRCQERKALIEYRTGGATGRLRGCMSKPVCGRSMTLTATRMIENASPPAPMTGLPVIQQTVKTLPSSDKSPTLSKDRVTTVPMRSIS